MKLGHQSPLNSRPLKSLFIPVNGFSLPSYPVRVRYFRLGRTAASDDSGQEGLSATRNGPPRSLQRPPRMRKRSFPIQGREALSACKENRGKPQAGKGMG